MALTSILEAVGHVGNGGLVIVVDDEDRENEGDLIMAAETATTEQVAFMIRHTSGIICAPAEDSRLDALQLPAMVEQNSDPLRTAFTVSTDYVCGMTTGVSALERARTLRALADETIGPGQFIRPGHVFPLRYRSGGVLVRSGHTEAAIDLCRLAGRKPVGALAELTADDGTMMRLPALTLFAEQHGLPLISIESLIRYRAECEVLVEEAGQTTMALGSATLAVRVFRTLFDDKLITVVVKGAIDPDRSTLVRVVKGKPGHDFLASAAVAGNVIQRSLQLIAEAPQGVFIYLPPSDGRGREDEQTGAVWREVGVGSHILASLGVRGIDLLASKDLSYPGIASFGLRINSIVKEA